MGPSGRWSWVTVPQGIRGLWLWLGLRLGLGLLWPGPIIGPMDWGMGKGLGLGPGSRRSPCLRGEPGLVPKVVRLWL